MGGRKQLTNEDIDKRIKDKNLRIMRISNYPGRNSIPMEWECLIDGYRWKASFSNLLRAKECPKCGGHIPLTNALIDEKLTNRNIKRISDYPGKNSIPMEWECLIDGYRWKQLPRMVLGKKRQIICPKCRNKAPLTNEDIDKLFIGTNLVRKSNFIGTTKKFEIMCTKHNVIFSGFYNNIKLKIKNGSGCYLCYREKMRLSNDIIDKRLEGRNIKRIGNYTTANSKIEFQTDDGYKWFATPASVLFHTNQVKTRKILSNEIIDKRLEGRNIKRIGNFIYNEKHKNLPKMKFLCTLCYGEWVSSINGVTIAKTGCPHCKYGKSEKYFCNFIKENLDYSYFKHHKAFKIDERTFYPDFYIEKNDRKIIIEYNGIQHYKPIEYFGGEKKFTQQLQRDNALKKFCRENNIEYIEIPYDINKKDAENLLIEKIGGRKFP